MSLTNSDPQQSIGAIEVAGADVVNEVDLRPHYFDPVMKQSRLVDSGSQVTAFPPDPGDVEDKSVSLKAVNGTKIKTYGYKQITIKINRKPYSFRAVKADVDKPVVGWDFMKHHRLDMRWGDWGDLFLYDRKAKIKALLNVEELPLEMSLKHHKLAVVTKDKDCQSHSIPFELAALQELAEEPEISVEKEDINVVLDSCCKEILKKYPELLKQTFSEESAKNNIKHRILTGDAKPTRAKTRRLLPGSPKEAAAKKAWMELVKLGIVEKVDLEKANT